MEWCVRKILRWSAAIGAGVIFAATAPAPRNDAAGTRSEQAAASQRAPIEADAGVANMARLTHAAREPEPSGPLDIPWALWGVLGTCAVLGTTGLAVSWQLKRRKQQRPSLQLREL